MLLPFRRLHLIAPAIFVLVLIVILGVCSGGGSGKQAEAKKAAAKKAAVKPAALKLGPVNVQSAGPLVGIDSATRAAVLASAQKYVDTAVHAPLNTGQIGAGYGALFNAGLRPISTGADTGALTDAAVGKANTFTESATPVALTGLADNVGVMLYLATNFAMTDKVTTAAGPVKITRVVELTFSPDAQRHWSVNAYRVTTARTSPSGTTSTTTAKSGATP